MFKIGDKVVYPMHGAGVIETIEEKEILGCRKKYYVMNMPIGDVRVMVPMDSVQQVGLREIIDKEYVKEVLEILEKPCENSDISWNRRYRANMDKIKSGNIFNVAEVVSGLLVREKEKGLSSGERKMLESAKQMVTSELLLVNDIDADEVYAYLNKLFNHEIEPVKPA